MPHSTSETDAFSANVTVPNAGEDVTAASIEAAGQPLANRTKHLRAHTMLDTTAANSAGYANDANAGTYKIGGPVTWLSGGTLSMLSGEGWYDVDTIIDEAIVREIIPALKKAGASGIIEYPLNKVIP